MKNKRVKCKSGLTGWQGKLRSQYACFAEFEGYSDTWGLAGRLGFKSAKAAWRANPTVRGSVEPSDYRRVTTLTSLSRKRMATVTGVNKKLRGLINGLARLKFPRA